MLPKIRFIASVSIVYMLTVGVIGYLATVAIPVAHAEVPRTVQQPHAPAKPAFVVVAGKPVRLVIPDYAIDLPVDEGFYDSTTATWTLSETHAQFAMMTTLANNASGNTFIYGHGTDVVFGKLGATTPPPGTQALIYTDNNRVLSYRFQDARNLTPDDTSVFNDYTGPSTLTLQTCTGSLSEWRTMFRFTFEKVVQ